MLDIIIFAIIALFLFFKLKNIIGKEDDSSAKVINKYALSKSIKNITNAVKDGEQANDLRKEDKKLEIEQEIKANLSLIKPEFESEYRMLSSGMPSGFFDIKNFFSSVENLFADLIKAKSERNLSIFTNELSPKVLKTLSKFIEEESLNNPTQKTDLIKIEYISIEDFKAKTLGGANLRIKIVSEQVRYSIDGDDITSGSITVPVKFTDYLTLERFVQNKLFVWVVTAIE